MKATLDYLKAELKLDISTLCTHLRRKAYPQKSEQLYSAMSSMIYYQLLADELSSLLHAYEKIVGSIEKSLVGEAYDIHAEEDQEPIHSFCLAYFNGEIPLGSSTPELAQWVASHADRRKILRQGFASFFPDANWMIVDSSIFEGRATTESDLFKLETVNFLQDIETSNALYEFNQLMLESKTLLQEQVPIGQILKVLSRARN